MSNLHRSWGISPPLYIPPDVPPIRRINAAYWLIAVPFWMAVAISFIGLGFYTLQPLVMWVTQ